MNSGLARLAVLLICVPAECGAGIASDLERPDGHLLRELRLLVLPQVECRDANLAGILAYLCRRAAEHSAGRVRISCRLDLAEEQALSNSFTLSLKEVPFLETLRYAAEAANVNLRIEGRVIVCANAETPISELPRLSGRSLRTSHVFGGVKGLTGPLALPAQSTTGGPRGAHRTMGGGVQTGKSGYVKHRSSGGWPLALDPANSANVNCADAAGCRAVRHALSCPMHTVHRSVPPRAH